MDDTISRQAAIDALKKQREELLKGLDKNSNVYGIISASTGIMICTVGQLPSEQPEIIRCKDCKCWVPGYITDNDDFIPPKCGEWQQMVGHSSDDYCSLAGRREVTDGNHN